MIHVNIIIQSGRRLIIRFRVRIAAGGAFISTVKGNV